MKYMIALILILVAPGLVYAQAIPPTKEVTCRACHGLAGAAPIASNYPRLNGQNKAYLVSSLKAYRAGERKTGLAAIMVGQAAQLSDTEIDALATYYSSQP